ncbi:MAG: hypothetical protein JNL23_10320 [Chitinophagaceae bacterium]|nr:hypothetical protein [Chitinophagaceae bacterium]
MKKQSILSITTTLAIILLILSLWFISCRKTQQEVSPESTVDNSGKESVISPNDNLLSLLAAKVEKQINASRASENIAAFAGQPDWQQSLIIEKNDVSSRSKKKNAKAIVYTPFARKNEHKTAAILQSTIYETDTVFQMLYPQQYLQYGFGAHSDTAWNAYDLFNIFASFDYNLYGTSQYIVNDGRIFGKNEKDTLLVMRQSGSVSNTANGRVGSSGNKLQAFNICTTWTSCAYGIDGSTGSNTCKTTQVCTTYWIEVGDGGGGSTTPGNTAGGGGSAGTPSNDPGINGTPCPTPTVARYNERAPEVSPCPQPWVPADIINNVTDPCLKKMVDDAISRDCSNEITNFINSAFHKNPDLDLTFKDAPLGNIWGSDGKTVAQGGSTGCYITITLNSSSSSLPRASKEYVAITILHEAIHAWIILNNTTSNSSNNISHEAMASTANINLMVNGLREMYPNISLQDAKDLAWGGLDNTTAWSALSQTDRTRIIQTNYDYKNKIKGTPCTP